MGQCVRVEQVCYTAARKCSGCRDGGCVRCALEQACEELKTIVGRSQLEREDGDGEL